MVKKQFYVQTDRENMVKDIVQFINPEGNEDYKPVMLEVPLPSKILVGCYELAGESLIYRKELDVSEDKLRLTDLEQAYAEIIFGKKDE